MSRTTNTNGRLGNQIIRNLAVSFIAERHNLFVEYSSHQLIKQLGINLFVGEKKYDNSITLNEENYFDVLNNILESNVNGNINYFQTKEIIDLIFNNINTNKSSIIENNPFNDRYNNNNDCFVHVRLGDCINKNPGIEYYLKVLSNIKFDNLYISSDTINSNIIHKIIKEYPKCNIINYDEISTIQFGSTCKYVVLSHGTFSSVIGYLSFYSNVYYPCLDKITPWHGELFSISSWNCVE